MTTRPKHVRLSAAPHMWAHVFRYALYLALFIGGMTLIAHWSPGLIMRDVIGGNFILMLVLAFSPALTFGSLRQRVMLQAVIFAGLFFGLLTWFKANGFHTPMSATTPPTLSLTEMLSGIAIYLVCSAAALWLAKFAVKTRTAGQ
jgi:type IV secretory pathway TrbD component